MYPDNLARALSAQLDAERAIEALTMAAFESWLPHVKAAVLPSLTASVELPPDPDQVPATAGWWELALDQAILYGIGLVYGHELLAVLSGAGAAAASLETTDPDDELSNTALARQAARSWRPHSGYRHPRSRRSTADSHPCRRCGRCRRSISRRSATGW